MAMSGIPVSDACKKEFENQMKNKSHKGIFYNINSSGKEIEVTGYLDTDGKNEDEAWEQFVATLENDKAVYCTYDLHVNTKEGQQKPTIVLITWCPDNCPIKMRMMTASTKETLKNSFNISKNCIQACDLSELDRMEVMNKLK